MVDAVTLGALQRLKYPAFSFSPPLTANTGNIQTGATLCPAVINNFATVAGAGNSGLLPQALPGRIIYVINSGANAMNLFPNGADTIDALGASNAYSLVNGGILQFTCTATGAWTSDAPAAGEFVTLTGAQTLSNKTLVDFINKDSVASTATTTSTNTTTLATITGLTVNLTAGATYVVNASIPVSTNATAGAKVALTGTASLTASSVNYTGTLFTASAVALAQETALGSAAGSTANVILAQLAGVIIVATAGTLALQGAQNVATTGVTSFLPQAFLSVSRVA